MDDSEHFPDFLVTLTLKMIFKAHFCAYELEFTYCCFVESFFFISNTYLPSG